MAGFELEADIGLKKMKCIKDGYLEFDEVVKLIQAVEISFQSCRAAINDSAKIKKECIEFVTVY